MSSISLATRLIIALCVVCIVPILVGMRGSGLRNLWRMIKTDSLIRCIYIIQLAIFLVQSINLLFSIPWGGIIVFVGVLLSVGMTFAIISVMPGRMAKNSV